MELPVVLISLGVLFLTGLAADALGRRTRLPRVTVLLACGIAVGSAGFDLIPPEIQALYEFLSITALTMVAFVLGSSLTRKSLARHGRPILWISLMIVLGTVALVTLGLWLMGLPLAAALLLGRSPPPPIPPPHRTRSAKAARAGRSCPNSRASSPSTTPGASSPSRWPWSLPSG